MANKVLGEDGFNKLVEILKDNSTTLTSIDSLETGASGLTKKNGRLEASIYRTGTGDFINMTYWRNRDSCDSISPQYPYTTPVTDLSCPKFLEPVMEQIADKFVTYMGLVNAFKDCKFPESFANDSHGMMLVDNTYYPEDSYNNQYLNNYLQQMWDGIIKLFVNEKDGMTVESCSGIQALCLQAPYETKTGTDIASGSGVQYEISGEGTADEKITNMWHDTVPLFYLMKGKIIDYENRIRVLEAKINEIAEISAAEVTEKFNS